MASAFKNNNHVYILYPDPCKSIADTLTKDDLLDGCTKCVTTQFDTTNNKTCIFFEDSNQAPGFTCSQTLGDTANNVTTTVAECK